MTTSNIITRNNYTGNGSATVFAYQFKIVAATGIQVYLDGVLQSTGFTVSGVGNNAGGSVTFSAAPANGVAISLVPNPSFLQETDYSELDAFPAESHELALDLAALRDLKLQEQIDRSLKLPVSSTLSLTLPDPVASNYLAWNNTGTAIQNVLPLNTSIIQVSAFMQTVLDDTSAAAARTTLGALGNATATAGTSAGILFESNNGTDVALFGAGGDNNATFYGHVNFAGAASGPAAITLAEDTDNGTNNITLTVPASIASNKTVTFPDLTGTVLLNTTAGLIIDRAYAEYTANADLGVAIPYDDTPPLNTEGTQVLSTTITPKSTTNRVRALVTGTVCGPTATSYAVALFRGSTCIASYFGQTISAGAPDGFTIAVEDAPASTSTQTYSVRVGAASGTMRMNGNQAARLGGGTQRSTLVLEEIIA